MTTLSMKKKTLASVTAIFIMTILVLSASLAVRGANTSNWYSPNGTRGLNNNYSDQTQVTAANVNGLEVKWIFPVPAAPKFYAGSEGVITTPAIVNGIVYFLGMARSREELDKVIALARMNGVRKIVSHVFLTDHVVVDVPAEVTAEVKPDPEARSTASKPDEPKVKPDPEARSAASKAGETKAKPESKGAKKKPSPRSAAPRIVAP